jgi:hypothetical protein
VIVYTKENRTQEQLYALGMLISAIVATISLKLSSTKVILCIIILLITSLFTLYYNTTAIAQSDDNITTDYAPAVNQNLQTNNTDISVIENFTLYYTKSGGLEPISQEISYNSSTNELLFIEALNHMQIKRELSDVEEKSLKEVIIDSRLFETKPENYIACPDCFKYALTITINNMTHRISWTDGSTNVDMIFKVVYTIEKLVYNINANFQNH